MLLDETCFFLAIDLDGSAWQNDALAIRETCRRLSLPAAIERSRSGNGAHVWLLFEEAVPAALARRVGSHIVTETMERRPEIGFASYDRMFPAQDTLPKAGFGNLIALPLQHAARLRGNSVFLDDELQPHRDQWAFLASLKKIGRRTLESIATSAEAAGRIIGPTMSIPDEQDRLPWLPPSTLRRLPTIAGPLPPGVEIVLADRIYVEKSDLSPSLRNRIIRLAAFPNPEFHRAQAMRLPTWGKPRMIHCAEDHAAHIALPRGCMDELEELARVLGIELTLRDERSAGTPLDVTFAGDLRPAQKAAAEALQASDMGVLAAPPGFGKTVIGAWLIAKRGVSTLVLVHRQQIQEQWIERLSALLGIPPKEIGRLGGGRKKLTGRIDVALIQSLGRKGEVDERVRDYGHVIVDECHHVPARTFERV
ncbi:MAG: DEAD/DEAH box helicase family protein, partial [Acidobacteria bacterium]|nr:DEAD/DEAH box helicase family protein [Acidobacteriota bacterium]